VLVSEDKFAINARRFRSARRSAARWSPPAIQFFFAIVSFPADRRVAPQRERLHNYGTTTSKKILTITNLR
jgi:hypothetical protein